MSACILFNITKHQVAFSQLRILFFDKLACRKIKIPPPRNKMISSRSHKPIDYGSCQSPGQSLINLLFNYLFITTFDLIHICFGRLQTVGFPFSLLTRYKPSILDPRAPRFFSLKLCLDCAKPRAFVWSTQKNTTLLVTYLLF